MAGGFDSLDEAAESVVSELNSLRGRVDALETSGPPASGDVETRLAAVEAELVALRGTLVPLSQLGPAFAAALNAALAEIGKPDATGVDPEA